MYDKEVFLPMITPLQKNGSVCRSSVQQLMQIAEPHVDGYVPCLTSGEGWGLSPQQWQDMVRYCIEYAGEKPVITGIERPTTKDILMYADEAERLGAKGIIFTAPFQPGLGQSAIYDHFSQVHDQTALDLYIYFESTLCNNKWEIDTLLSLCALPRVVAIKESSGEDLIAPHLRNIRRMGVKVYQGWEDKLLQYDNDGCMVSYCNLKPDLCRKVVRSRLYSDNAQLTEQCQAEGIFDPDWYKKIKSILFNNRVISTDFSLDDLKEDAYAHAEATLPA